MSKVAQQIHFLFSQNKIGRYFLNTFFKQWFNSASEYWEKRYAKNGNSGVGSYGPAAEYKAFFLNSFVSSHEIRDVMDFGCGDGNQLKLFKFPMYTGLDVSLTALRKCIQLYRSDKTKSFFIYDPSVFQDNAGIFAAELVISLDIVYHLIEDHIYNLYMQHLFGSSTKFVIIYAWDVAQEKKAHVKHRKFTSWIRENFPDWALLQKIEKQNDQFCDFFVYHKVANMK